MRALVIVGAAIALALVLALGHPSEASAASCEETSCGVPSCWQPSVRLRPDMTRTVTVWCYGATSAKLVTPPAYSDVSNVSTDGNSVRFDARPHDGAPRDDEAVFEISGHEGSVEQRVGIEVVPTSENSPPICDGARATQRSDGSGPVDVYLNPYCHDPDGDDFVVEGGPPGVHPQSPKKVQAGDTESNWTYRTRTFSGDETTTIWATDVLGARSADAELKVSVGPGVDRLPQCTPSSWSAAEVIAVNTRPGKTRRFAVVCSDPDGDPFASRLSSPPQRGALALVEMPRTPGYFVFERWSDATYVPADDSLEPDPFSVTATGAQGDGPEGRMAMVPHELPYNGGGGCGWSPAEVPSPGPGIVRVSCSDDEGDDLSAEIVAQPHHGTIAPAVVTPSLYGFSDITIPYVPDPGYEGYDCIEVRVTDGNGLVFKLSIDIWVRPPVKVEPPELPLPDPPLPQLPPTVTPPAGEPVRSVAERILGTRAVKRVRTAGRAQVWARSTLSRRDLLRRGSAPGMVVVCSKRCRVRALAELAIGARTIRLSRGKTMAAVTPGQPHVLSLTLGDLERQALRRARKPQARFKLSIRPDGATVSALSRSIPVSQ